MKMLDLNILIYKIYIFISHLEDFKKSYIKKKQNHHFDYFAFFVLLIIIYLNIDYIC